MEFGSDNVVGASEPIIEAIAEAARSGPGGTYGEDRWTRDAAEQLEALFERKLSVFLVPTGTAANALSLAALTPPWGGVLCHTSAHVNEDECGAPEFFTAGAKLIGVAGEGGKIAPEALRDALSRFPARMVHRVPPSALSLSQSTEAGTIYSCDEIASLAAIAHAAGLSVHMDGARFGNALVSLGCSASEMTWRAGVDALSFGATKNGALACEAIVLFDPDRAEQVARQRKRGGHTLSKGRVLGAQMAAYLRHGHWLDLARHANGMAKHLADGLSAVPGVTLPWPRQTNEVFAVLPRPIDAALRDAGAHYYEWDAFELPADKRPGPDQVFVRLICSFETRRESVDRFVDLARQTGQGVA